MNKYLSKFMYREKTCEYRYCAVTDMFLTILISEDTADMKVATCGNKEIAFGNMLFLPEMQVGDKFDGSLHYADGQKIPTSLHTIIERGVTEYGDRLYIVDSVREIVTNTTDEAFDKEMTRQDQLAREYHEYVTNWNKPPRTAWRKIIDKLKRF